MSVFDHKHASKGSNATKPRRLSIPVSVNLQGAIDKFKSTYPDHHYNDTAVLVTMIEAGFKLWAATELKNNTQTEDTPVQSDEHEEGVVYSDEQDQPTEDQDLYEGAS